MGMFFKTLVTSGECADWRHKCAMTRTILHMISVPYWTCDPFLSKMLLLKVCNTKLVLKPDLSYQG